MDHLPIGSIVELVFVDVFVVLGLSAACGAMVAKGADRPLWRGLALGVLVPILGPVVWGLVLTRRRRELGGIRRLDERSAPSYLAAGGLMAAGLAFGVGMFAPWGHLSGGYKEYSLAVDGSAVDAGVLWVAWVLTAVLAVMAGAAVLGWSPWRRVAILLVSVASVWLMICLDGVIIFQAVADVSELVEGTSGGRASAEAAPGLGLWLALVGALFLVGSALVLGFAPHGDAGRTDVVAPSPSPTPTAWAAPTVDWRQPAGDWGDPQPEAGQPAPDWGDPMAAWGTDAQPGRGHG